MTPPSMEASLRILHLDCTMGRGGQERDHIHEALEFVRRGHTYWIGARPESRLLEMARKNEVGVPLAMKSNFDLFSLIEIRRFIVKNRVNVLITTSYIDAILGWFAAISLGSGRPPVFRQRHLLNPPSNMIPYRHFCDYLVAVSDMARYMYIEKRIPFWKVVSIPRGIPVPTRPLSQSTIPILQKIPESARIILQVGTFQRDKGQLSLIEGLRPYLCEDSSLHLILLGEGPLKHNILHKLESDRFAQVRSRIHLPGWLDPAAFYLRSAVTVVPSFRESFSLVAVESIYFGVPVVAFRQGGLPEIFEVVNWGELVEPWDQSLLSRTAVRWAQRAELSCPNLDTIRKAFIDSLSIGSSVTRSERFYRWAINMKHKGPIGNPYARSGGAADPFCDSDGYG